MRRTILLFMVMAAALLVGGGVALAEIGTDVNNPKVGSKSAMRIKDLGTLGGESSEAYGINDLGQVVGISSIETSEFFSEFRPVLWEDGKMTDLGTLPDTSEEARTNISHAYDINDLGQIVGGTWTRGTVIRAFLWEDGSMTDLGFLGFGSQSEAYGINNLGQVVGYSDTGSGGYHAFLWEDGKMTDLGTFRGGDSSQARAINNRDQVVGYSANKNGEFHAALWRR